MLTAHLEPGADLGELNLLVRGLDVHVVPECGMKRSVEDVQSLGRL